MIRTEKLGFEWKNQDSTGKLRIRPEKLGFERKNYNSSGKFGFERKN